MAKKIWEKMRDDRLANEEENEKIRQQANQQFNDLISKQGEYDTSKHTTTIGDLRKAYKGSNSFQTVNNSLNNYSKNNSPSIWEKMGYIMDNFGTGVHQGTVGIAQGLFTDSANEMQKGKAKSNNELFNNFINAYAGNDLHHIAQSTLNTINEGINILNDKDKNLWQKMVDINLNTVSNGAKALLPMQGFYSSANQVIGKVSDTDQQLLEMNKNISEPLEERKKELANKGEEYDGATKFLGEAGQVIGNMIPSITASAITKNPSVALGVMGASVKGQATQEALDKGMSLDKATQIGDAKALIEVATEKLSGGTKVFGHGSLDDIAEELVKKGAKSKAGKFIMTQLLNAGGEIAEEEISNVLGNAIDKGTTDPDKKVLDMKEAFETMGSTAFTTTMLNLLTGGMVNDYRQISNNMNQYKDTNTGEILDNSSQDVLKQAENIINENKTPNLQQQSTQNEQILPTQQINQEQNNVAQNGNMEQVLPTQNNYKNQAINEINNSYLDNQLKQNLIQEISNIEVNEEGLNQIKQIITEQSKLDTKATYKTDNNRKRTYMQYKNSNVNYDTTALDIALDSVKENRNGKRTVKQWLEVADNLGKQISDKSNSEIEQIAFRSWHDLQPNTKDSITRYDNRNKTNVPFQKFTSDDWVNTIYKAVNETRENSQQNIANSQEQNNVAQNGNMEQILPIQKYYYEKSDNVKIDNLRQDVNKYFDNSEKTHNFVNMLEKIIEDKDIEIRLDENLTDANGNMANGKYENGTITINPNSNRAGEFIAIHELTHAIGTDSMRNIIENYRKSNTEFDNAVKSLLENYNTTELTDEAMADVSAQLFGNQEYINNLAQENPNLFKRIYNEIKYLWHQFRGYKNQNEFIEDLQYKWEQAYRDNDKLNNTTNYLLSGKKSLTANKNKLNEAMELKQYQETNKMSDEDIFKKTGWYLGGEGKWKYEINDKNFKLKDNLKANTPYWLEDVFDAPELYQAYPNFKHISVDFLNLPKDIGGGYNKDYGMILNNDILNKNPAEQKKDILHEIQHAIQHEEEFAEGSDSKTWAKRKEELQYSIDSINKDIELIHNAINLEPFRNTLIDRMSKGENIDYWKEIEKFENNSKYAERLKELNNKKEKYIEEYQKIKNRDDFELYQNTAGEQEARDVEVRSTYTDKQRKNILPLVKNDKTVYIRGNNSMKEGASNVDNGSARHKTHTVEYTGNDNTREYRLPSRDSNTSEGNGIFGDSKQKSTQNQRGSSENIETNNIENSNKSSFSMDNKGRELSKGQQERYKDVSSDLRDKDGNLKNYYHGTKRADRVGNIFDPNKATSGPMAFFTDNEEIAKSYSENKQDTSLSREYDTEYDLFKVNNKSLDEYWDSLTKEQQDKINNEGYNIGLDEDFENIVHEKDASKHSFSSQYDYYLKNEENNNGIKALFDVFIQDGNLMYEDMKKFEDVLKYAGIKNVEYLDPYKIDSKVYNVYLNVKNPFNTSNISNEMIEKLEEASKTAKQGESYSADIWDKSNISPKQWIERFKDDIKNGTAHAWTSIPDWVTDVLKNNGYDGIVDTGGKNGGVEHQVVIPFYSNQIKNVDNLNPTDNPDIRYSKNNQEWQSYLDKNIESKGTKTNLQDIKLPIKKQLLPTNDLANNNVNENTITNNYAQSNENNTQNIRFNDNEIKESEKFSDDEVAKILTEPSKPNNEKRKFRAFLKANLIDKGMVFEELSRKTGNRELQGKYDYILTAEARGQNAIGNARYDYQPIIDENEKIRKGENEPRQICKSLTDIIDEVGENQGDFNNYMYHLLNIDRMTLEDRFGGDTGTNYERTNKIKNKPVFGKGVTAELSQKYVQELEQRHPEFKEYAQDVYDYLEANKQELVKSGVISQETSDLFKEMYPHYVPIARITNKGNAINVPLDTGRTGINTPIKRAKGGNRDIQPLFQTMADRTLQTYRASAKNSFGVELKNTLQRSNQLNQNTELTDIDNILDSMTDETKNNELLQKGENGNNPTFTVFENGKKVTYEISNDMYDALKPKNEIFKRIDEAKLSKGLTKFNNFRRGLLTEYNPVFSITNAIKDAQDVLLNSQHATKTYSKIPEATAQILGKGYWYKEYIQNGGEQNSYFRDGEFEAKKTNLPSKIKDKVTLPLRAISNVNNVIEMTPRLAEYIASRENGASIETAMLDASRVTTNFKAGGDFTKTLNRNGFTFLNASVQGMQQQIRNVQEANAKGLKGYATLATKYAIAGIPTLILNNLVWKDDDDYEDLQDYVKDNYYIIGKTENGQFIRIPKGRAVATIQKIVSNANDFIKDTSKGEKIDMDKLGNTFWNDLKEDLNFAKDNLAPNNPFDNNVIAPITQVLQNKTWYGEDLIPSRLKDKPKEEQYDETTDWLSKWIGEQLKVSPIKVNYLLDQYSGGVGDVILPMMTPQAENNVIEDKFSTNPIMKNKYPGKFFEEIDKLNVANNSEKATDLDKVKYKYATDLQSEISDLYKEKREIQNSSKEDSVKKSELEKVQAKINKLAEKGLNEIEKIKINGDTSSIDGINYYKLDGKWKKIEDKDNEKLGEISLKTYADFKNKIKKETDSKKQSGELDEDQQLKDKDEIALLKNSKYSDKEKKEIYSKFINTKDTTYSSLNKITNVNINAYLDYKLQDIKGDEDTKSNVKGKTVSGSKKENVYNYLSNSNLSTVERLYIYGTSYKLDNQGRTILQEAINSSNLSQDEKLEIYGRLTANVEKYKDGTYHWK